MTDTVAMADAYTVEGILIFTLHYYIVPLFGPIIFVGSLDLSRCCFGMLDFPPGPWELFYLMWRWEYIKYSLLLGFSSLLTSLVTGSWRQTKIIASYFNAPSYEAFKTNLKIDASPIWWGWLLWTISVGVFIFSIINLALLVLISPFNTDYILAAILATMGLRSIYGFSNFRKKKRTMGSAATDRALGLPEKKTANSPQTMTSFEENLNNDAQVDSGAVATPQIARCAPIPNCKPMVGWQASLVLYSKLTVLIRVFDLYHDMDYLAWIGTLIAAILYCVQFCRYLAHPKNSFASVPYTGPGAFEVVGCPLIILVISCVAGLRQSSGALQGRSQNQI